MKVLVRTGVIVDVSITDTPRKPRIVKLEGIVKPDVEQVGRRGKADKGDKSKSNDEKN